MTLVEAPERPIETPSKTPYNGSSSCCTFPFASRKLLDDFKADGRSFGSYRSGRKHAASDLLNAVGTPIVAISDGEILDFYEFACTTHAVVVDHGQFIARYGEIHALAPGIKIGHRVTKRQKIATVGRLECTPDSMLHLELYKGTVKGELSKPGNEFFRRGDLFDPTDCVSQWIKSDSSKPCWERAKAIGE